MGQACVWMPPEGRGDAWVGMGPNGLGLCEQVVPTEGRCTVGQGSGWAGKSATALLQAALALLAPCLGRAPGLDPSPTASPPSPQGTLGPAQ